jgi:hypothetical protein
LIHVFGVVAAVGSLWLPGVALVHHFAPRWTFEDKLVYGFAAGLIIALILVPASLVGGPTWLSMTSLTAAVLMSCAAGYLLLRDFSRRQFLVSRFGIVLVAVFVAFWMMAFLFTRLPVKWPETLPDGAYIKKERESDVRIQVLSGGFPIDNVLPYVFSQYLIRGVDFIQNAPILPGQPVGARTPLMAIVATHMYGVTQTRPETMPLLPTFSYVGSQWPDYRVLYDNVMFKQFLLLGIGLNASVLLAIGLLSNRILGKGLAVAVVVLASLSPFILVNSFFTWPKLFAAFGFLLALDAYLARRHPAIIGALLALGFYAHPMAGPFALGLVVLAGIRGLQGTRPRTDAVTIAVTLGLAVLPWILWSRFGVHSHDNLFTQNWHDIPAVWGVTQEIQARITNYSRTLFPYGLTLQPPNFIAHTLFSWVGATGLVVYYFAAGALFVYGRDRFAPFVWLVLIPVATISLPFRKVHGGLALFTAQVMAPLLMIAAARCIALQPVSQRITWFTLAMAENLALLWAGFMPSLLDLGSMLVSLPLAICLITVIQIGLMATAITALRGQNFADAGGWCGESDSSCTGHE